jgi:hypothetical protein
VCDDGFAVSVLASNLLSFIFSFVDLLCQVIAAAESLSSLLQTPHPLHHQHHHQQQQLMSLTPLLACVVLQKVHRFEKFKGKHHGLHLIWSRFS